MLRICLPEQKICCDHKNEIAFSLRPCLRRTKTAIKRVKNTENVVKRELKRKV